MILFMRAGDEGKSLKRTPTIHHGLAAKRSSLSPNSLQMRAKEKSEGSSLRMGGGQTLD